MPTIRALLDALDEMDHEAIDRLCEIRDLNGRLRTAKREAIARSVRAYWDALLNDLRKQDLGALLADPTELDDRE